MKHLRYFIDILKSEWRWTVIFFLYMIAWIIPFGWMRDQWQLDHSLLSSQPFILPIFFIILFGWRDTLRTYFDELDQWSRHTGKKVKNGSLTLLITGCLLFFFAHFSRLSLAAILGLILMLLGTFVRIYNKQFLKIIAVPIAYLLCVVPWFPETVYGKINSLGLQVNGQFISKLFSLIGKYVLVKAELISVNGASIPTSPKLYGFQGLVAILVFFTGYGIYRKLSSQKILSMNLTGLSVAFVVHQIRLTVVCLLIISNPVAATKLSALNCWIFTIPSILLTFLAIRLLSKIQRPQWIDNLIQKTVKANRKTQKAIDKALFGSTKATSSILKIITIVFHPITWTANIVLNLLVKAGSLISSSNKSIENGIRTIEKKIKARKKK